MDSQKHWYGEFGFLDLPVDVQSRILRFVFCGAGDLNVLTTFASTTDAAMRRAASRVLPKTIASKEAEYSNFASPAREAIFGFTTFHIYDYGTCVL